LAHIQPTFNNPIKKSGRECQPGKELLADCKFSIAFLSEHVSFTDRPNWRIEHAPAKNVKKAVLIDVFGFGGNRVRSGTMLALAWVGQRDTRWLIPLTVSAVTRVRKVAAFIRR
jgi:hypothetical protein